MKMPIVFLNLLPSVSITGIVTIVSALLAFLSFASKNEVTDAIREMERKFEVLSQQALKLPRLEVFYKDELASGKIITIPLSGDTVTLNKLYQIHHIYFIVSEFVPFVEEWENKKHQYSNLTISNSGYSVIEPVDKVLELLWK